MFLRDYKIQKLFLGKFKEVTVKIMEWICILMTIFLYSIFSSAYALDEKMLLNKNIQAILDESRTKYNFSAISVSLKLPEDIEIKNYVSGYYSSSTTKAIDPTSLFQVGSITKTFTATIIFKLIEEKKLSNKDNLGKWLPQYPRWKNITIDNLLHHTSGVYNYSSGKQFDNLLRKYSYKNWSLGELAQIAYKHPDFSLPGKRYHYTNTDYILLGMIIEKITNKPIKQNFIEYFKQYNLKNTFYLPDKNEIKNRMVHGYNRDGTFKFNKDVTWASTSFGQSAGAMISTPYDLIKWLDDLFAGKIITHQSLDYMTSIISEESMTSVNNKNIVLQKNLRSSKSFIEIGAGEGLGLLYFKNAGFAYVHAGGMPGYESFYAYNPCTGIYLVLAYNIKPKEQLIFIQIANEIFGELHNSSSLLKAIKIYQHKNTLPAYCK